MGRQEVVGGKWQLAEILSESPITGKSTTVTVTVIIIQVVNGLEPA